MLALVASGLSFKETARRLNVSRSTVKLTMYELYKRIGVHSQAEAIAYGIVNRHIVPVAPDTYVPRTQKEE